MSHKSPIRKDKTCLNCNHVVAERYCPNCGQENTDTRKTFYHLFVHFFEDLTHYENAFWKTIRNLLFKPASLTREYLSGKRLSYLAPRPKGQNYRRSGDWFWAYTKKLG